MSTAQVVELWHKPMPPRTSGMHVVQSAATGAAAASMDWAGGLSTNAPKGRCFLRVEVLTQDAYIRFSSTATTGTTVNNGLTIKVGTPQYFWVDPTVDRYIDHLGAGVGTIKVQVCSPIGERNYV